MTMLKQALLSLLTAILFGVSIASGLLVVILMSMLERYSKDVAEVIATWQYITAFTVVACIALSAALQIKASVTA